MRYVTLGAARKVVCPRIHFDRDEQMLGMTTPLIDVDPWSIAFWSQITLVYGVGLSPLGPNCGLHTAIPRMFVLRPDRRFLWYRG